MINGVLVVPARKIIVLSVAITFLLCSPGFSTAAAKPQDSVWPIVEINMNVGSSISIDHDELSFYVADFSGHFHRFTSSGEPISGVDLGTAIQSSAAISPDGTLFIGSKGGDVYGLTPDLSIIWQDTLPGEVTVSPTLGLGGEVFFGTSSGLMVAYSEDGVRQWTREVFGYIGGSPAIGVDGTLLFGTDQGQLFGLDPTTGETRFVYETDEEKGIGSVAISNDGDIYFGTYDNALIALDSSGNFKWRYNTSGRVASAPVIDNSGRIYIAGYDSHLIEVLEDQENAPALVWSYEAEAPVYATPAVAEDQTVYVGDTEGNFYALNQNATDKVSWQVSGASSYIASPVILDNGNILIVDTEGTVQAFEGNGFASAGDWPMFGLDQQRTANKFDIDGDQIFAFDDEDSDGDGMPDSWEHENGTQAYVADGEEDLDGDIYTNSWEHENGTSANENEFDDRPLELLKAYSSNSPPSLSLPSDIVDLVVSPDGDTLVIVGKGGYQILARDENGQLIEVERSYVRTYGASFSPDGKDLYLLHQDLSSEQGISQARFEEGVWERQSFRNVSVLPSENSPAIASLYNSQVSIRQTENGEYLYVGARQSGILVYERNNETGELSFVQQFGLDELNLHPHVGMSLSSDDSVLRVAGSGQTFILSRDSATGVLSAEIEVATESSLNSAAGNFAISPDGDWLASFRTSDKGALEWLGSDNTLKYSVDTVPLSSSDLIGYNHKRSLVYVADARTTNTLATYYFDPVEGFVLVDQATTTDISELRDMKVLAPSPQGDHLYVIAGNSLLDLSAGYKGIGRPDRDGDGVEDILDVFADNPDEWADFDNDGTGDNSDTDIDGDGCLNPSDDLDFNADECLDTDGDGIGNNSDPDDDGDGYNDGVDAFALDGAEWADADNDGVGDNEDLDDDNDGMSDLWERENNLDPYDDSDAGLNPDGDNLTNLEESQNGSDPALADTDGDGYLDHEDQMPQDDQEHIDTDGDGIGNVADTDDDGDGLSDACEMQYGFEPLVAAPEGQNTDGDLEPEDLKLTDAEECEFGSDPTKEDPDVDQMPDAWEVMFGLNPHVDDAEDDFDNDGYWNQLEYEQGTDPTVNEFDDRHLELLRVYSGATTPSVDLIENVQDMVVSPDGETLVVLGTGDYQILSRDGDGTLIEIQRSSDTAVGALFSANGQDLYLIGSFGIWPTTRGVLQLRRANGVWAQQSLSSVESNPAMSLPSISSLEYRITAVESRNGHYLYVGARESGVLVYQRDIHTGALNFVQQFMPDTYSFLPSLGMTISFDNTLLRVASFGQTYRVARDVATGILSIVDTVPTESGYQGPAGLSEISENGEWLGVFFNNGRGDVEWRNEDNAIRYRADSVPLSNRQLFDSNLARHFVYVGSSSSSILSAYQFDPAYGITLFDQLGSEDAPELSGMDIVRVSSEGNRVYVLANDKLLEFSGAYRGLGRPDRDGDGVEDILDVFPDNPDEWADFDDNGTGDNSDTDIDGDGCLNPSDDLDFNADECLDTDGDGIGNNSDPDDDGDGYNDGVDAFALDGAEWADADNDGVGDNEDLDDDNDGMSDLWERENNLDPYDDSDAGLNPDGDNLTNLEESQNGSDPALADTDGDGYLDHEDQMPRDDQEHIDTDGDGIGNVADTDDDGDGLSDACEMQYGFEPLVAAPEGQNTDGDLEPEGLKLTDAEECELGSDPTHIDGDNDNMPDVWELAYGLEPLVDDAQNDLDFDGYSNLLEYDQGTDPTINEFDDRHLELLRVYSGATTPSVDLIDNVRNMVISPDSGTLIILGSGDYQVLTRDGDGKFAETQRSGDTAVGALFSADGQDLYLIGNFGIWPAIRGIVQFRLVEGVWTQVSSSSVGSDPATTQPSISALNYGITTAESNDGTYLYVGSGDSGVLVYQRDPQTGALAFVQQFIPDIYAFRPQVGMTLSTDNSVLRVASSGQTYRLARDASTGMLELLDAVPTESGYSSPAGLSELFVEGEWLAAFYSNGQGSLEWHGNDDVISHRSDAVLLSSRDLFDASRRRSLVYGGDARNTYTLSAHHLDSEEGITLFDQVGNDEIAELSNMDMLRVSPLGDYVFVLSGDVLLEFSGGYKGIGHPDSDGDGYRNLDDAFPNDPAEWLDSDGDGYGDNSDVFPHNANEWADFDSDGEGDNGDTDIDGDGCLNDNDEFDFNSLECLDADGDGVGNNADTDDDNDRLPDVWEEENGMNPFDASDATLDSDGDGLVNEDEYHIHGTAANDVDSDGDGMDDGWEVAHGLSPIDNADAGLDNDGDGFTNAEEYAVDTDPEDPRWYPGAPGLAKWKALADASVRTKPLVDQNGTTYVGSIDGKVYAFDSDGNEIWVTNTGAAIEASPAMGLDGSIYVGTADGALLKVDLDSPYEPTTLVSVGAAIATTPAINDHGVVYFGADNGRLYAIDSSGNELWSYDAGSPVRSSPKVTSDGIVRFGDDSGQVHAIYGETGAPVQ